MDQYIKKKSKVKENVATKNNVIESASDIVIRQTNNELADLVSKYQYIQRKITQIKKRLEQLQLDAFRQNQSINGVLGASSLQKSSIKIDVSDGKTSQPNKNIQKAVKLESATSLAQPINDQQAKLKLDEINDDKLSQSSKIIEKAKKIRKRV